MLIVENELHSVLTIAKALRESVTVYCNLIDHPGTRRVQGARAEFGTSRVEVLTVYGWKPAARVWIETGAGDEPEMAEAAAA